MAGDVLLQHKRAYLNGSPFSYCAARCTLASGILAMALTKWSRQLEQGVDRDPARTLQRRFAAGALGLAVYALTVTFAAIDWVMSL